MFLLLLVSNSFARSVENAQFKKDIQRTGGDPGKAIKAQSIGLLINETNLFQNRIK
ncbi:MAG: hypothetical protein R2774_16300 [Saprospiraceae bacterium]